jgi:hypothetical protein
MPSFFPAHLISRLPLTVPDLVKLGATCSHFYAAVFECISRRSDIRMPIGVCRSELVKDVWDTLTALEIFLETTTCIQPTRVIDPLPRRLDTLRRLHLDSINLPPDAASFWTHIFEMAPALDSVHLVIVTYPKRRFVTEAHVNELVRIGAPRLAELHISEAGPIILGSLGPGNHVHRIESETLRTLRIEGMPLTCTIDAPVTSVALEEVVHGQTGGLVCLGSRSYETLIDLKMNIHHHTYDIQRLRRFKNLITVCITLYADIAAAITLLGEVSNKLAGTSVQELEIRFQNGGYHGVSWIPQPAVTFNNVFRGLANLRTFRMRFDSTPVWMTDFVCAVEAPSLANIYLESDDFRLHSNDAWTRHYGLQSGTLDASRLRSYLEHHPTLRISTKNIAHS